MKHFVNMAEYHRLLEEKARKRAEQALVVVVALGAVLALAILTGVLVIIGDLCA